MDRNMLEQHLAQAQQRVAQGARFVVEQRERVAQLERLGADCALAIHVLALFEDLQAMYTAHVEQIRRKLPERSGAGASMADTASVTAGKWRDASMLRISTSKTPDGTSACP